MEPKPDKKIIVPRTERKSNLEYLRGRVGEIFDKYKDNEDVFMLIGRKKIRVAIIEKVDGNFTNNYYQKLKIVYKRVLR